MPLGGKGGGKACAYRRLFYTFKKVIDSVYAASRKEAYMSKNEQVKLKRALGFPASYGAAVGLVVSSTAMFSVATVGSISGNATFISAFIALIPVMVTAFAFGELTAMLPSGGMIAEYTAPALGKFFGTFALLSGYIVLISTDGAMQIFMGGRALEYMTGIPGSPVAVVLLATIILINIIGVQFYGRAEASITVIMMIIYAIIGILGAFGAGGAEVVESQRGLLPDGGWPAVFGAVGTGIWFFIGFEFACPMAEENKKPYKNIPWGLILGLISIYIVDIIFIFGVVKYGNLADIGNSDMPQITAATYTMGKVGMFVLSTITLFAGFTTCNAYIAAFPRMLYGLSREGQVPKIFQRINPRFRVPIPGIVFTACMILSLLVYLIATGGHAETVLMFINTACICWLVMYIIAMLDVLVMRKRYPDYPRLWKAPAAWVTLPIGILGAIYAISTMTYVLLPACIIMAIIALYTIVWNKANGQPINEVAPLKEIADEIMQRSEPLPVWDEQVRAWIEAQD
jgi:amino acid transporter